LYSSMNTLESSDLHVERAKWKYIKRIYKCALVKLFLFYLF